MLGVLGLLSGSLLSLGARHSDQTALTRAQARLAALDDAIARYYRTHGTLPCPAALTIPEDHPDFGRATPACDSIAAPGTLRALPASGTDGRDNVASGAIPVRSLGLPDSFMYDPWGSRIHYALIAPLATQPLESFSTSLTSGVLQIVDASGAQITPQTSDIFVPYALWSPGPDKRGAYSRAGVPAGPDCGETSDSENCTNNAILRDADITDATTPANFYFDLLVWNTNKLMAAKTNPNAELAKPPATTNPLPPLPVGLGTGFVITWDTICALTTTGKIYCAGNNPGGMFGDGSTAPKNIFTHVAGGGSDWSIFDGTLNSMCGLKTDRSLWCWGQDTHGDGRLGLGASAVGSTVLPPTRVGSETDWENLVKHEAHACAMKHDQKIYCWGSVYQSQTGTGYHNGDQPDPILAWDEFTDLKQLFAGLYHTCALRTNGRLYCVGTLWSGSMGDGTGTTTGGWHMSEDAHGDEWYDWSIPRLEPAQSQLWKYVDSDMRHMCGINAANRLYCWGWNETAQVGNGTSGNSINVVTEVGSADNGATFLADWKHVSAGYSHSCAVRATGEGYCWGMNEEGQLGNGTISATPSNRPVRVQPTTISWDFIIANGNNSCGRSTTGQMYCWGANDGGQLGNGGTTRSAVPLALTLP